jgi:hypothetical protein
MLAMSRHWFRFAIRLSSTTRAVERALGGGVYHGHDGIRQWQRDLEESWGKEIGVEPEACFDLREHTLIYYVLHACGTQSGAEVAMPIAAVARWQSDLLVYSEAYLGPMPVGVM